MMILTISVEGCGWSVAVRRRGCWPPAKERAQ